MNVTLVRLQWFLERQAWNAQRRLGPYFDTRLWTVPRRLRPAQRERCLAFLRGEEAYLDGWRWEPGTDTWDELRVGAGREAVDDAIAMFEARRWTDGRPLLRKMLISAAELRAQSYDYAAAGDPHTAYLWKAQARDLVDLVESLLVIVKERAG